jgi:DNA ligase-1
MWASPKLDGIRAVVIDGVVMSRNLKPIPNKHVQKLFGKQKFNGLDGELLLNGVEDMKDVFRHTSSAVMSVEGEPEVHFHVFDSFLHGGSKYSDRMDTIEVIVRGGKNIKTVTTREVENEDRVAILEEHWLELGYEGVMLRRNEGCYKFGRSTLKESLLLKLKRFSDSEAVIIGAEEQMENTNEKTKDALGHSKRSSHKAGKVAKGKLGALVVRDLKTNVEFNIGSGFNDEERTKLWSLEERPFLSGRVVKYRYFPTGSKDKPRFPTFLGFRDVIDI